MTGGATFDTKLSTFTVAATTSLCFLHAIRSLAALHADINSVQRSSFLACCSFCSGWQHPLCSSGSLPWRRNHLFSGVRACLLGSTSVLCFF
ncbi:hypothetical protein BRADI_1g63985v3 [Brachypodium distachyon]|uniref:Uncharacterized protein n=1 Tax=Brachypodium distachyon TaxID=15368 RepID=A0A2K2DTA8_BRADI|nr:hypothetical protein BRADI_1g63985v3 [Brachypodium distachyon]